MKLHSSAGLFLALVGTMACASLAAEATKAKAPREAELSKEIVREGSGDRRAKLNAAELTPFNFDHFKLLADARGELPTADSAKGKPVLVFTFSSWTPTSKEAVAKVAEAASKFASQGLIVVAAHADKRFEDGLKLLDDAKLAWPAGRDTGGKFRSAIMSDGDPDLFIIDRAGQVRFADIETDSIARALEVVCTETAQEAGGKLTALKADADKAKAEAAKTTAVSDAYRPGVKIRGMYVAPDANEYEKTLWPRHNDKDVVSQQATNLQGKELPKEAQDFAETVEWMTPKPSLQDMQGRVVLLEFWATWCGPCKRAKPMLDDLAEKNRDDLVAIAFAGYSDPKLKVSDYLKSHKSELMQVYEPEQAVYKAFGINAIPFAVVLSTDGKIRWQGNPLSPDFRKTVESIIAVDPGVAVRRKADDAARKAVGG